MILVDTSVWVDHLHAHLPKLADMLDNAAVLGHPWVTGELALGSMAQRDVILGLLANLPQAAVATADEVLTMVRVHRLHGRGIGYVDAQLLASTLLTTDARLWTGDRRLAGLAAELGVAAKLARA
jgi:predicted nucleic acid-binding protein